MRRPHQRAARPGRDEPGVAVRESGMVPSARGALEPLAPAQTLSAPRDTVRRFGARLAAAGELLLVGGRLGDVHPFAALYRVGSAGAVRERLLRGVAGHRGPSLATDGTRVAVGQPATNERAGTVGVYRVDRGGVVLEASLEAKPDDPWRAGFGERLAIAQDLLVVGQPASLCVYRHSPVGWLSTGALQPHGDYSWSPAFGRSLAILSPSLSPLPPGEGRGEGEGRGARARIVVGSPVELDGHRAGPGRAFVYRIQGDRLRLEATLQGDGIESGRHEPPRLGFGASVHAHGETVVISAPYERSPENIERSRVYVYRTQHDGLAQRAAVTVPSCQRGACMIGGLLYVIGDAVYVFAQRGDTFDALATYSLEAPASALARCGPFLILSDARGAVTLYRSPAFDVSDRSA